MYLSPSFQNFKTLKIAFILLFFLSFIMVSCEKEVVSDLTQNKMLSKDVNASLSKKGELGGEKAVKGPPSSCLCEFKVVSATNNGSNLWSVEEAENGAVAQAPTFISGEGNEWVGSNGLEPLESDWVVFDEPQLKISDFHDPGVYGIYTVRIRCQEVYSNGGTYLVGAATRTFTFVDGDNDCIYWDLPIINCVAAG